jgi:hypothetical protein
MYSHHRHTHKPTPIQAHLLEENDEGEPVLYEGEETLEVCVG